MKAIAKTNLLDIDAAGRRIRAFSTQRNATDPALPYSGFNACHYTNDSAAHVAESRCILASELNIAPARLVIPRQTHSSRVAVVDSAVIDKETIEGVDALVSTLNNVALCINTADCVPIVMADAQAGIIGAAHSGWRGTVARIAALTIEEMIRLGADPAHIVAAMGPSICAECFEVGEEVAELFREQFGQSTVIERTPRPHVDLAAAIVATLEDAGISLSNISLPPACSHCNPATYFSARRMGINSGRTLTTIIQN